MRAVFLLLLLANLLLFGWIMQQRGDDSSRPAVSGQVPGVERILLLSELEPAAGGSTGGQESADDAEAEAGSPAEVVAVAEESSSAGTATAPVPVASKPEPAPAVVAKESCHTIGPFRDLDELRGIIKSIKDQVLEASFRSREETEQTLFWVYLEPESDHASAKATTRMLRQKRIKDSYIIAEGDKRFGISLGHFREKQRATALRDKIARLGFRPRMDPVFRSYTIYWLDYRLAANGDNKTLLDGLSLAESVNRFDRSCQ